MDSTAADSRAATSRWRLLGQGLLSVLVLLYALQVALVVAFLLGLAGSSQGISVVVEGSRRVPTGSTFVLTASAWAGPGEPWLREVDLRAAVGVEAPTVCRTAGSVWHCTLRAPQAPGRFDARVEAWLPGSAEAVVFGVQLDAVAPSLVEAMPGARDLDRAPSPRGRSLAGRDREPSVLVAGGASCPWQLAVVPEGGIAVANVLQGYWLHLVDAEGAPRTGVVVECSIPDEPLAMRGVTDALGTALLERTVPWEERWSCRWNCDGAEVTREVSVNPSWDGIVIAPARSAGTIGVPAALFASHQRTFGGWYLSLLCDGSAVGASAYAVEAGRATFEWSVPIVSGDLRLCSLQAATSPRGVPSARTAHWWMLRSERVPEALAVERLAAAAFSSGPAWLRAHADQPLRARIAAADGAVVSRYGRFVLAALPQPWTPSEVVTDGIAERGAVWEAERLRLGRVAVSLLVVDVVLLMGGTALLLVPSAMRRRRALLRATDDEADEDSERLARLGLVGGIGSFVLAVGVLAAFAVAMSTLLTAIW